MSRILAGSTIPAFKMTDDGHWWWWLRNAQRITRAAKSAGHEVEWLAVCQHDARGQEPFGPLLKRLSLLSDLTIATWWFSIDPGESFITGASRLGAICTGRNLIIDAALRGGHDWIYFADADVQAPDNVLVKLLELCWPVVGAHVPTYCLDGPPIRTLLGYDHDGGETGYVNFPKDADARLHWNTAGSLLIERRAFRRVPWRHDPDAGSTDDPATQHELAEHGWPTVVRHDVVCTHHPESIGPLETRGHDLTVYR